MDGIIWHNSKTMISPKYNVIPNSVWWAQIIVTIWLEAQNGFMGTTPRNSPTWYLAKEKLMLIPVTSAWLEIPIVIIENEGCYEKD